MSRRIVVAGLAIAVIGAIVAVGGTATAASSKKSTCNIRLVVAIPPGRTTLDPNAKSGHQFGLVSCNKLFGTNGVQSDDYKVTPTSSVAGRVTGTFADYFNLGIVHGTYKLNVAPVSPTQQLTYSGSIKIVGGTGAFKGMKGTGTLTCVSNDVGVHIICSAVETFA